LDPGSLQKQTNKFTKTHNVFPLLNPLSKKFHSGEFQLYLKVLEELYLSIADGANSNVIVDSSKFPMYGEILNFLPGFEVYTIHIIRDPRAVAFSWMHPKKDPDPNSKGFIPPINPLLSSGRWVYWNVAAALLGLFHPDRYLRIRYEDLARDPQFYLQEILNLVNESESSVSVIRENVVNVQKMHAFGGNPSRYENGNIAIKKDERWRKTMPISAKILVSVLTLPLLLYFNYKLKDTFT